MLLFVTACEFRNANAGLDPSRNKLTTSELRDGLRASLAGSVPMPVANSFSDTIPEKKLRFWYDIREMRRQGDTPTKNDSDLGYFWGEQLAVDSIPLLAPSAWYWALYLNEFLAVYIVTDSNCRLEFATATAVKIVHPSFEAVELTGSPPKELVLSGTVGLGSDLAGEILTCDSGLVRIITPQTEPGSGELPSALTGSWSFQDDNNDGISEIRRYPNWKIKETYHDRDDDGELEFIRLPDSVAIEEAVSILEFSPTRMRFVLRHLELE